MIANYASVYLYTITHWEPVLGKSFWSYWKRHNQTHVIEQPYPLYPFSTGVVTALAQSFLVTQYWLLTKNHFITLTLFLFITAAIGGAFACALIIAIFPQYKDRGKVVIPGTTWLVTEAATDISIALVLLLEFRKVKSSFEETRSLLNRLVVQTIRTGAAGATIALAVLVAFLANDQSNVPTSIGYCIGRVYCITMLANLNSRETGKTWSSIGTSSDADPETRDERGNQERSDGDDCGGIHVHRSATVHIDAPQEFSSGSFNPNHGQGLPDDSPTPEIEMTVNDSAPILVQEKTGPVRSAIFLDFWYVSTRAHHRGARGWLGDSS
ncbi:hypothetical protein MVEN_01423700 [Mycena venus]|uniref:DUF6534 domain-containing protein n=1 Tax=Mycena venus TaxID=2733690 RepID=A0A8H6XZ57_9AGAR|nr:hypothetical protein MVEN_01423700 [Mycena venus]